MVVVERGKIKSNGTASPGGEKPVRRNPLTRWYVIGAIALAAVIALLVLRSRIQPPVTYTTAPVVRQTLVQTVTASGTVNPQDTISVGTQDSGTINQVFVDFNSQVHKGQVLATLDPTSLQAALDQARANLAQAEAQAAAASATAGGSVSNVQAAQASAAAAAAQLTVTRDTAASTDAAVSSAVAGVAKAQSALSLAQMTVNRDRSLSSQGYIAQSQLDTDTSNLAAAQAGLQAAQVAEQQARLQAVAAQSQIAASVAQAQQQTALGSVAGSQASNTAASAQASQAQITMQEALVQQAELNLQHAVITSPVDGTVIARDVSVGQTVAAGFQTPTLFLIAQNLGKMEVDVAVGEPDIGSVRNGEAVDFTVLAYPTRTFHGVVSQVRQNPTVTNNVVTYDTVVLVPNADGALRPGMTANASVHVAKAQNALVVPVEALQYQPSGSGRTGRRARSGAGQGQTGSAGGTGAQSGGSGSSARTAGGGTSPWGQTGAAGTQSASSGSQARIFVLRNGKPQYVPVTVTLASGAQAAVEPSGQQTLSATDQVIVSDSSSTGATSTTSSAVRSPLQAGGGGRGLGPVH